MTRTKSEASSRGAAAEDLDVERAGLEVEAVEVGDLEFAAGGGLQVAGEGGDLVVVEVEAGDGVVGSWKLGLLLERDGVTLTVELDDAVGGGIGDVVAEDRGASGASAGGLERGGEFVTVEEVVAEDEGGGGIADKIGADVEGLREPLGAGLFGVFEAEAELGAVAEEAAEEREVLWRGDDQDFADTGEH